MNPGHNRGDTLVPDEDPPPSVEPERYPGAAVAAALGMAWIALCLGAGVILAWWLR